MYWPEKGPKGMILGWRNRGPMLRFFKYYCRKIQGKKLALLTQNKAKLCKNLIITFLRKTPIFSPKIDKKRRKL
jgi:hypothetical protein